MTGDPEFRTDLYRGTARWYDEFRVPYPRALLGDLLDRAQVSGTGQLLDLGCGTGQVTFGLAPHFARVLAVDQEPETIAFASGKAARLGVSNISWATGRAEEIRANGCFELVTIGNAFHRMQRRAVAEAALRWLAPGGHLALLWGSTPWTGSEPWHEAIAAAMADWTARAQTADRVPAGWAEAIDEHPNEEILAAAGFTAAGSFEFVVPREWNASQLTGFMFSTSMLSREALGPHAAAFEADLHERLAAVRPDGVFTEQILFAYDLVHRP